MTCAKKHVECCLITKTHVIVGTNRCNNPQKHCPRKPGEGYEKCTYVCGQPYHAEMDALTTAEEHGIDVRAAIAIVRHWRVCDSCQRALEAAGVKMTVISPPRETENG